jgi:putative DNA primase/helicase
VAGIPDDPRNDNPRPAGDGGAGASNQNGGQATMGGDAERIARALGNDAMPVRGGWLISCPVAGHGKGLGDRSPSLKISDTPDGKFLAKCYAGCMFEDVVAALEEKGLLSDEWRDAQPPSEIRTPKPHEPSPEARALWRSGSPATPGSVVQRYLQARGITLDVPPTLRGAQQRVVTSRKPLRSAICNLMIAAVQRPDGEVVSVQRTTLRLNPLNVPYRTDKITFGALDRGAVRLAAAGEILGIAEGVESGLSAMQLTGVPVWVALGCRLASIAIPSCVKELHVFADNDEPGRNAAEAVVNAYAGRKVVLRYPPKGFADWNDALVGYYKPRSLNDWRDISRLDAAAGVSA